MPEVLASSSEVRATATEELRRKLDELRNLASDVNEAEIRSHSVINLIQGPYNRRFVLDMNHDWLNAWHAEFERILQAIAATLGREPWVNPTWERWHKSLKHDKIKSIGDAVEQLMYEAIEFGGDMGPNGNTYNGIDEGDVLTAGFINAWVARFESTLGRDRYSYGQWREISNAVGDAMEYAHDRAIEHPDAADPLWNLDEYVNRILKVAFEGEATLERGTCHNASKIMDEHGQARFACSECGAWIDSRMLWNPEYRNGESPWVSDCKLNYCPNCGRRVVSE